jgi:hypothetical protein
VLAAIVIFLLFAQAEEVTEGNAPAEEVTTDSPPVITGVAAVGKDGETSNSNLIFYFRFYILSTIK